MRKEQIVQFVDFNSPAYKAGIQAGDVLLSLNGEPVLDLIDYEYLSTQEEVELQYRTVKGDVRNATVHKMLYEPLGLGFETSLMSDIRTCANRCIFCFVDQMPKDMRSSLYVKDDDWRMSFIMGNYITLTNTTDEEFNRILKRKVSPLYVSVHSTDPEIRSMMMGNRTAGKILERLKALKDNGITFHTQIVLCPGINDGENLKKTLLDLSFLYPYCRTCAVVPVGLTKFRKDLTELHPFSRDEALQVIMAVQEFQKDCLGKYASHFVFLSDEWYLNAGLDLPAYEEYEEFDQIENGVGLLRLAERDFIISLEGRKPLTKKKYCSIAGGSGCADFFKELYGRLSVYNIEADLYPIRNTYFGGNVNVAGLVTGTDIISQLKGKLKTDTLYVPKNMLREKEDVFLDDVTIKELEEVLHVRVIPFTNDTIIDYLFGDRK